MSEPIRIEKTNEELNQKDRLIVEHGRNLVKSAHSGGIISPQRRECSNNPARLMNRLGKASGILKDAIHPQPLSDIAEDVEFGEDGDCDE